MEPRERHFRVDDEAAGVRLDAFLARHLAVSRAEVRRLLARGAVSLGGREADAGAKGLRLDPGMQIAVAPFAERASAAVPAEPGSPLAVLAEGPGWLAVDKPAGVPVHPLEPDETGTLLGAVAAAHPEIQGVGEGGLRSGVVHRLDVGTSGAVLFATREDVWRRLRDAFAAHRVDKRYRAILLGSVEDEGRADVELVVARHRPARVRVVAPGAPRSGARPARLAWRVLERFAAAVLVEVRLETGFLHQIRATFADRGAPVAGDRAYGPPAARDPSGAARQMLHASRLALDEIAAASPDPPDFSATLARLRAAL